MWKSGAEAVQFPEKEYIKGIAVAVYGKKAAYVFFHWRSRAGDCNAEFFMLAERR
jgi:hypothetical protein